MFFWKLLPKHQLPSGLRQAGEGDAGGPGAPAHSTAGGCLLPVTLSLDSLRTSTSAVTGQDALSFLHCTGSCFLGLWEGCFPLAARCAFLPSKAVCDLSFSFLLRPCFLGRYSWRFSHPPPALCCIINLSVFPLPMYKLAEGQALHFYFVLFFCLFPPLPLDRIRYITISSQAEWCCSPSYSWVGGRRFPFNSQVWGLARSCLKNKHPKFIWQVNPESKILCLTIPQYSKILNVFCWNKFCYK